MSALEYGEDTRRALAHITGRTRQGFFAAGLYDWSAERWAAAVEPLERAGIVESAIATAADDPTVTRGWVLLQPAQMTREQGVLLRRFRVGELRLTDGVGEGADRNVTDIDETLEPPRDQRWSVEQARWIPERVADDPAALRGWVIAVRGLAAVGCTQYEVQQLARQNTAGPSNEASHQPANALEQHQRQEAVRARR